MAVTAEAPGSAAAPVPWFRQLSWAWLGLVPFFVFAFLFMILPSSSLFIDSFRDADGQFTLNNLVRLFRPDILQSYLLSIEISAVIGNAPKANATKGPSSFAATAANA